jgi:hypothetical protein
MFRCFHVSMFRCFDVSIEPKQTGLATEKFDREHILLFFTENVEFFLFLFDFFQVFSDFFVFFVFFGLFRNCLFRLLRFYTETESFD